MRWLKTIFYLFVPLTMVIGVSYLLQEVKNNDAARTDPGYKQAKWPALPAAVTPGNPTGIGIDTNQNIVVFHRAGKEWPLLGSISQHIIKDNTILIIHNKTGELLSSWGGGIFVMPHGLTTDNENNIWVTDIGLHQVFKFTHDGQLLLKLGEAGIPGNDSLHFNKPTDIAIANDGSFFVSDGYGNSRIMKFSPQGKFLFEWGSKGMQQGAFDIPHGLCILNNQLYVADRENARIQVFDLNGTFIRELNTVSDADICALTADTLKNKLYTVDDLNFMKLKHRGSDIIVSDTIGIALNRFGRSNGTQDQPCWFHDIAIDNEQNIFVGDILNNQILKFERITKP